MFGYHGRYLRVDLTDGRGDWRGLDEGTLRRFIGGVGLGVHIALREGAAASAPFGADNVLVFAFSPLVGSPLTTSAKFAVVGKSPLTERCNDSLSSSGFALAGKKCGADAIAITGCAREPSILIIDDGAVQLESAQRWWGANCGETESALRDWLGPEFQLAVIGPAGERRVRFATLSHAGRHAGRGGHGAVMGAKRLKAIAVRGTQRCAWADPAGLYALAKSISAKSLGPATAKYRELGTVANLVALNRLQALPSRNFAEVGINHVEQLTPEGLAGYHQARVSCVACTIGCEHLYRLSAGSGEQSSVRIEYENVFALGPLCGIHDAETVLRASQLCDSWGIDTISAGGTIAFAMECAERGLLHEPWLRFGDGQALLRALDLIARREGLGDRLAEGSRRLAESLGSNALAFAPQIKGLEIPGYEPRTLQTMALGFAVGTRGADHNRSGAYEADFSDRVDRFTLSSANVQQAMETEDRAALMDSLILCKFLRAVFVDFFTDAADMLRLITGWNVTADELQAVARRIVTARKLFNVRAGWQPADDTLPARFFAESVGDARRISREDLAAAVKAYNLGRGWTADGWLDQDALAALGLCDLLDSP